MCRLCSPATPKSLCPGGAPFLSAPADSQSGIAAAQAATTKISAATGPRHRKRRRFETVSEVVGAANFPKSVADETSDEASALESTKPLIIRPVSTGCYDIDPPRSRIGSASFPTAAA